MKIYNTCGIDDIYNIPFTISSLNRLSLITRTEENFADKNIYSEMSYLFQVK